MHSLRSAAVQYTNYGTGGAFELPTQSGTYLNIHLEAPLKFHKVMVCVYICMCMHMSMCVTYQPCFLRERIIPYGRSVNIECPNSLQGVDYWTQNSDRITPDTVGIDPSTIASKILHVQSMSLQLEGQYQCFTANSDQPLDTINVYVIGKGAAS